MKNNTSNGSWMWRKLLKIRELAKNHMRMNVRNGKHTSFWYDAWSSFGYLKDLLGERGTIGLGITVHATVEEAILKHRKRRHRLAILNDIENEIEELRKNRIDEEDIPVWRQDTNRFANCFSTKKTWLNMRQKMPECRWNKGVCFLQSTPKFSFMLWVAAKNRLQTCDRLKKWNIHMDDTCVLCNEESETCSHLFFQCRYTSRVWRELIGGIMKNDFTLELNKILELVAQERSCFNPTEIFIIRYSLQAVVHSIWRERNGRRHGEQPREEKILIGWVDKIIRSKLLAVQGKGYKNLDEGLGIWFGART